MQLLVNGATKSGAVLEKIRYWCQDETKAKLKTLEHCKLTAFGVKPIGTGQWKRQNYYLYGVVEPKTGESFFYEFSHLDTQCFEKFLQQFSQAYPEDRHILQLDNGPLHKAEDLRIPENIVLFFQPAHSPEVKPIERLWEYQRAFFGLGVVSAI